MHRFQIQQLIASRDVRHVRLLTADRDGTVRSLQIAATPLLASLTIQDTSSPRALYLDVPLTPMGAASSIFSCVSAGSEGQIGLRAGPFSPFTGSTPLTLHALGLSCTFSHLLDTAMRLLRAWGVATGDGGECLELTPGICEMRLASMPVWEAADQTVLLKTGLADCFQQVDSAVLFWQQCQQRSVPGGLGRIALCLWDTDGERNLFRTSEAAGEVSPLLRQFLAGVLATSPDFFALYVPPHAFSRDEAPGCEVSGVCLIAATRRTAAVEHHFPGAGVSYHLACASLLAGGLYGIEHNCEQPGYRDVATFARWLLFSGVHKCALSLPRLPPNPWAALQRLEHSRIARDSLGEDTIDQYGA